MEMFCRDCQENTEVRKEKTKNHYAKEVYYFCTRCGVIVLTLYENRRRF